MQNRSSNAGRSTKPQNSHNLTNLGAEVHEYIHELQRESNQGMLHRTFDNDAAGGSRNRSKKPHRNQNNDYNRRRAEHSNSEQHGRDKANSSVRVIKPRDNHPRRDAKHAANIPRQHDRGGSSLDVLDRNYWNLLPNALNILTENKITPLKKVKRQFPLAKYICNICEYHCDTLQIVQKHITGERHMNLKVNLNLKKTMEQLPAPNEAHKAAIDKIVQQIHLENRLSGEDLQMRKSIRDRLVQFICQKFPGCDLQLYGSSLSGFGLAGSDVNLHLCIPDGEDHAVYIDAIYQHLNTGAAACDVKDVISDFMAKVPTIHLKCSLTELNCSIHLNNTLAVQTSQLLAKYYQIDPRVPILGTVFALWAKICGINQQSFGTLPSYSYILMLIHFLQQCSPPVLPIINEEEVATEVMWKSENTESAGGLWLQLLRYFTVTFKYGENVINVRKMEPLGIVDKSWGTRKIAIEDPYSQKRNVARSISHGSIFDFIQSRLRKAYLYFGIPQTKQGALFHTIATHPSCNGTNPMQNGDPLGYGRNHKDSIPLEEAKQRMEQITSDQLDFCFNKQILTDGEMPAIICRFCQKKGHLDDDCPEDKLPDLIDLPPMTEEFQSKINEICHEIMNQYSSLEGDQTRSKILSSLESFIQESHPEARLEMFGSSCNGFGFHYSDLDICLTFNGNATGEGLDSSAIVEELAERLEKRDDLTCIMAIPTAKVPIVKFTHKELDLEGDISLYNTLAIHNTRMLRTYCKIDRRLQVLGYTLKRFAKLCDIGAASRGSLSSYAYILMVIYFLQQRKPAVLPVLQELYDGEEKPQVMIQGWNAWFYDDLQNIPKLWPDYGKNKESAGQLWIGLMEYYTKHFDFNKYVIAIKQKALLTRQEKLWASKCIVIEDPFELSHNLGAGVSRKMNKYILKAFIKGREIFGCPIDQPPKPYEYMEDYLFDPDVLTNGVMPPNDRGCFSCGNFGHQVKDCPKRLGKKAKRDGKNDRLQDGITGARTKRQDNHPNRLQNPRPVMEEHKAKDANPRNSPQMQPAAPAVDAVDGRRDLTNQMPAQKHAMPMIPPTDNSAGPRLPFPPLNPPSTQSYLLDDPAIISCVPERTRPVAVRPMPDSPPIGRLSAFYPPVSNFSDSTLRFQTPPPFARPLAPITSNGPSPQIFAQNSMPQLPFQTDSENAWGCNLRMNMARGVDPFSAQAHLNQSFAPLPPQQQPMAPLPIHIPPPNSAVMMDPMYRFGSQQDAAVTQGQTMPIPPHMMPPSPGL